MHTFKHMSSRNSTSFTHDTHKTSYKIRTKYLLPQHVRVNWFNRCINFENTLRTTPAKFLSE